MVNMCMISCLERQYAKRYQFHTLAGRWGGGRDLGRNGAGLVWGLGGWPGRPAQETTEGALAARFAGPKAKEEADDTKMIPKR